MKSQPLSYSKYCSTRDTFVLDQAGKLQKVNVNSLYSKITLIFQTPNSLQRLTDYY